MRCSSSMLDTPLYANFTTLPRGGQWQVIPSLKTQQSTKCSALVYHMPFSHNLTWTLIWHGFHSNHSTPSHFPTAPIVFVCLQQIGSKFCIGNANEQYSRYYLTDYSWHGMNIHSRYVHVRCEHTCDVDCPAHIYWSRELFPIPVT